MNIRVRMAGEQAGGNPKCRWEGEIIAGPFKNPKSKYWEPDMDFFVVCWDKWTGKDQTGLQSFTDIYASSDLKELI